MNRLYKLILIAGILVALGLLIHFPAQKLARAHVNLKTGVTDHPLLCTSCHLHIVKSGPIFKMVNKNYYSPFNLAVSNDGKTLYIVAQEANVLLIADAEKNKIINKVNVGNLPYKVILSKDGKRAYVSNQWADNVSVIDLATSKVIDTLTTSNGPAGLALSADGNFLYAVNSYSSDISIINLESGEEIKRLAAGNNPTGVCLSPDGKTVYVTSRRAVIAPYGEKVRTVLTVIDDRSKRVTENKSVESAHMIENVAFTPTGDLALVTMVRPKNLVPSIQVERGFMMNFGIGVIEQKENGRIIQLLLDEPDAYYADPYDIVVTSDGKKAFVSNSGVDCISVIDIDSLRSLISQSTPEMLSTWSNNLGISSHFVVKRIHTGANPKGLALSPDGKILYVAEQLEDRIAVINTQSLETVSTIDLGGPRKVSVARRGRRLFANAGHTFQNQFSCYTCHPDYHEDGLVYNMASKDMGRNLTNTQSLRDISETAPFKWNGKNATVFKQDGIRFSTVLTRTEKFSYKDLDAITSFIMTGIPYPPNLQNNPTGTLTEVQMLGKEIFERSKDKKGNIIPVSNRCITCHPAPYFTNLKLADVGTLALTDDSMKFDTPHLNNIYASPPYLHDGRAATLEEIWTKYNPNDKHGVANDLTKIELNELIEYLKTLSSPDYYKKIQSKYHAQNTSDN
jgi:YVTN family beta-propeller protein